MYPTPSNISKGPYIFKIETDYVYAETGWSLKEEFVAEWLHISKNGVITVKANEGGYVWNGCSPKLSVFNLFIVGTPDGHIDHRTMKPYTYFASLVHDALYQYLDTIPIKSDVDELFLKMLDDFKPRKLYYFCVKHFGGCGVVQRGI